MEHPLIWLSIGVLVMFVGVSVRLYLVHRAENEMFRRVRNENVRLLYKGKWTVSYKGTLLSDSSVFKFWRSPESLFPKEIRSLPTGPLVLVIDDDRTFTFPAVYAKTSMEAYFYVREMEWDEIWWDHDLGEGGDTRKLAHGIESGRIVVKGNPVMVVHSANLVGANELLFALSPKFTCRHVRAWDYME